MEEQQMVMACVQQIFISNGYENLSTISHRDYNLVAEEIAEKTGILISVSTIKRLLKGQFSKAPQVSTLNALATYIGYKNWQEYKQHSKPNIQVIQKTNLNINWKKASYLTASILMISLCVYVLRSNTANTQKEESFSFTKTTSNNLPNTVVFNYDVSEIPGDSFFIQQSWDINRRVKIDPNAHTLTDIYFEPGHHIAKLIVNDQVIKTLPVKITTAEWFCYVKSPDFSSLPIYLQTKYNFEGRKLSLTEKDLVEAKVSVEEEKYIYLSLIPKDAYKTGENFTFRARARLHEYRANHCPFILFDLATESQPFFFSAIKPGCESNSMAQFGERFMLGKQEDLSAFSYDIREWLDVRVEVKNKEITIFYNNQQVYKTQYKIDTGNITGFTFISNGICEVEYIQLLDKNLNEIFSDDFNTKKLTGN
ncbi:MAG TPA: hypothetical protein PKD18_23580 [Saprospiraceae bacterium]|nr:hypothetical protein [Saprospiraceae bacterium]